MSELAKYNAACRALAAAKSVDEVKDIRDKAMAMRLYAQQAKNKDLEGDAIEIRLRAERRLGEMMAVQPKQTGGDAMKVKARVVEKPEVPISLADAGIDKNLANRARTLAAMPAERFEETVAKTREAVERRDTIIFNKVMANSGDNEWNTPAEYIELARQVLGVFDLDPASNEFAQRTVRAAQYFTAEDDGLQHEWRGRVWLNPPYTKDLIGSFVAKLVYEYKLARVIEAILLVNNCTDTEWFQEAALASAAICFSRGRVRYEKPEGPGHPTQGQCFLYFGDDPSRFISAFGAIGFVMVAPPYDSDADVVGSFNGAYQAVRERVAAGGPPWVPKEPPPLTSSDPERIAARSLLNSFMSLNSGSSEAV